MKMEDYSKYYIQGSDHYLIPKDVFKELFDEMSNWRDETKQLKEVIEEAIEYIDNSTKPLKFILELNEENGNAYYRGYEEEYTKPLLQILDKAKGDSNE